MLRGLDAEGLPIAITPASNRLTRHPQTRTPGRIPAGRDRTFTRISRF